jgi:hypothetical protein
VLFLPRRVAGPTFRGIEGGGTDMFFFNLDRRSVGKGPPLLRVRLENTAGVSLTVAIQTSADGVNWTTTRIDRIPLPPDPTERT